jgi:hypothetical protein
MKTNEIIKTVVKGKGINVTDADLSQIINIVNQVNDLMGTKVDRKESVISLNDEKSAVTDTVVKEKKVRKPRVRKELPTEIQEYETHIGESHTWEKKGEMYTGEIKSIVNSHGKYYFKLKCTDSKVRHIAVTHDIKSV